MADDVTRVKKRAAGKALRSDNIVVLPGRRSEWRSECRSEWRSEPKTMPYRGTA